jgi:hypothetical protein
VHLGRTVLANEPENRLVQYCITMDQRYYELRRQDIKRMVFQLSTRNGLKHPLTKKNQHLARNGFDPF